VALLEGLYDKLPAWSQNLGLSAYGAWVERQRYGGAFSKILKSVLDRGHWSGEQIARFQHERAKSLLRHAHAKVPYYKKELGDLGVCSEELCGVEDLARLPVLTKEKVRERQGEFLSSDCAHRDVVHLHTSGTTGAGLQFVADREAHQEQWAVWWRYRMSHGIKPGTWCAYFGGRTVVPVAQEKPPFWRINRAARQILYSMYHISPGTLRFYIDNLQERKLNWIHGYPSVLSVLARYVLDAGVKVRFTWATVGAESLMPWQKALIEEAFGCRCCQHYGSAEGVANFSECEAGNLHADEDFCAVELLPAQVPGQFFVAGTSLVNYAMPFIRYHTGDVCSAPLGSCACGRWGLVVSQIDGRQEDYILLRDGRMLGRLDHIFKDAVNVLEAQIVQKKAGEAVVRIVPRHNWSQRDAGTLREEFRKRAGPLLDVTIEYCEKLERTASGKLRFVVSSCPAGRLDVVVQEAALGRGR
jgi:phenylacetate-CoA ligase